VPPAGLPPFHKPGPLFASRPEVSDPVPPPPLGEPGSAATAIGAKLIAAPMAAVATATVVRWRIFLFIMVSPFIDG
jgi:hypothetical protein